MKIPKPGEIWLANYPYLTPGNMEKIRPVIIKSINYDKDTVVVQKLTTKKHNNKLYNNKKLKKTTYISNEQIEIRDYNLIRYIGQGGCV